MQGGNAIFRARDLEIHVAQRVFHTLDVAQDRKAITRGFGDEAHGDAGHGRHNRHTSIHQRQGAAADGGHGGRAVGRQHFGHNPQRVRELVHSRDHRLQGALGQGAVPDLATLGAAHGVNFARRVRWEVVVVHVALRIFWHQGIERLRLARRAERGNGEHLGFAAGEQTTAMGARQNADRAADRSDFGRAPTIGADAFVQNAVAHLFFHQAIKNRNALLGVVNRIFFVHHFTA